MAGQATTIARPYAEAVFARAEETSALDAWSDALALLAGVVQDQTMAGVIADPLFDRGSLTTLMLEICSGNLDDEGQNLVKLLVVGDRLPVLPEIAALYEVLKAESQRTITVSVRSAYQLESIQEQQLAEMLKVKLGREVTISSEQDPELIGGVHIRAGDLVIDGSVRGKLQQLANELGI
jgi:F-type H+-transporting ATPase subunit delta